MYLAFLLLIAFAAMFVIVFIGFEGKVAEGSVSAERASPATVTTLLEGGDTVNGNTLVEQYGCVVCHRLGAENGIAPSFVGLAARAAQRRSSLSAAEYLYESITNPTAYVVEGYNPAMPQDYSSRLSERELGDIIAYLLSPGAH